MNKRCAIYLRVSTQEQDYQRQKDELVEYLTRNSYTVNYVFEEKISGASKNRPEFDKMCLLDKEQIDVVAVWELSRLSRSMSGLIKTIEDFSSKGISVISLKERFESLDQNGNMTASTLMMLSVSSAMVQIERTNIKERMTSGRKHKILSGEKTYTSKAKFGYDLNNGKLSINESEAEIVKNIYNDYLNGSNTRNLSIIYNIPVPTISSILRDELYTGRRYSKVIDGYVETPVIIKKSIYDEVQVLLRKNKLIKRVTINTSPMKAKIYCSKCGHLLSMHGGASRPKWSCHCHTTIVDSFVDRATKMALVEYNTRINIEAQKTATESKILALREKTISMSELVDNMFDKIEEEKKKLEVLKDVFSTDQLKREVYRIKTLERERDKQDQILQNTFKEIAILEKSITNNEATIKNIDKVIVDRVSFYNKILNFYIYGEVIRVFIDYKNSKKPTFKVIEEMGEV